MSSDNPILQKQKIEQEIARLQSQVQDIVAQQRKPILSSIVEQMIEFGISINEVAHTLKQRSGPARKSTSAGTSAPIKYRHPQTGDSWSGRGKPPRWLVHEEQNGHPRESFLVDPS